MNEVLVRDLERGLMPKSSAELLSMWQYEYFRRGTEASEALRRACIQKGLTPPKRPKFAKASGGDILLSILLPVIGLTIGFLAVARGQNRRGLTLIAISGLLQCFFVVILLLGRARGGR